MPIRLPKMDPCYFCECVLAGAQGWNYIERNDDVLILLNGRQYEMGQCMVVPVRHAPTLLELNDEDGKAVMRAARRIATAMVDSFSPDGILLYQNNGEAVGQEVPHFHLHVVPRRLASSWGSGPPHVAAVIAGERAAHEDFARITDEKRATVAQLKKRLALPK